ncbi:hypothetical protein SteCoe_24826 [Stentor coeruleus]|uniref:Uncharacterized protein n=1 Tax=Stentor coeruleus TaxID=5963 RepID=A0A1R2BGQ5_9CILI|nr:hypothetical protein SteCoe_24826 [Stentor coeruleus]
MMNSDSSSNTNLILYPGKRSRSQTKSINSKKIHPMYTYNRKHAEYIEYTFDQNIQRLVRRISNSKYLQRNFHSQPIFRLLTECAQILMLSVVELLILSIYLDKISDNKNSLPADVLFIYLSFAIKKSMVRDVEVIKEYLKTKISNFEETFNDWENNSFTYFDISLKDINKTFRKFRNFRQDDVNYSFYVDEILQASPPYQIETKEIMKQIMTVEEDLTRAGSMESAKDSNEVVNIVETTNNSDEVKMNKLYRRIDVLCANSNMVIDLEIKMGNKAPIKEKSIWFASISKF